MSPEQPVHGLPLVALLVQRAHSGGIDLRGVYAVGGVVRDALLGRPVIDLDLAVEGDGHAFAGELASVLGGRVAARHRFGTAVVVAALGDAPDARIDIATARTETYEYPGELPTVCASDRILDDLERRDFTINAVAAPLDPARAGELVDPLGGVGDLQACVVRVLHDASFTDDPTRIFRAARYAGRYGLTLTADTRRLALQAVAGGALDTVSVDRVRAELELVLEEPAGSAVRLLDEFGVLAWLHPNLAGVAGVASLVDRIDAAAGDDQTRHAMAWRMRLAAVTQSLGEQGTRDIATFLNLRARDIDAVYRHARALKLVGATPDAIAASPVRELRTVFEGLGPESLELAALATARDDVRAAIERFAATIGRTRLALSGHDLLAMGLQRGPAVGEVLDELYDRKLAGELPTPADEQRAALELVEHSLQSLSADEAPKP